MRSLLRIGKIVTLCAVGLSVRLEGGGHFAVWSMADPFLKELILRVRPLAQKR